MARVVTLGDEGAVELRIDFVAIRAWARQPCAGCGRLFW